MASQSAKSSSQSTSGRCMGAWMRQR
uniref:Uncharacterized protein n=1 Tax=Anguilla anguilla TaxID=7936 RepID=A0A0E9VWN5_ANGAN